VIQEEFRHILLYANLMAWHRANLPWWRRVYFELRVVAVWAYILWERMVLARRMGAPGQGAGQDTNFTATSAKSVTAVEIGTRDLMMLCLKENDRRFAGYDVRLLRPTLVPRLVRFALSVTKRWTKKRPPQEIATRDWEGDPQKP
jgi:hypothetical protein